MAPETPKGVSSRLLTMKFMQRAAASASPATPESGSQSSKKRKLDHTAKEGRLSMNFDQAAIQAAINEQQATRQAALDRHVTGDTHWVLKSTLDGAEAKKKEAAPMRIKYIGYGDIDSDDESGDQEDEVQIGRTSTNNYKQTASKKQKTDASATNGSESGDSNSEDSDSETSPADQSQRSYNSKSSSRNGSRSRSHSRQRSESIKAKGMRDKRKKKDVALSKLTSISSGGNKNFSPSSGKAGSRGGKKK